MKHTWKILTLVSFMAMGVFAQQTTTATQPPKPAATTAQAPAPAAAKSAPATTAPAQAKPAAAPAKEAPKAAPVAKADTAKAAPAAKPAPAAKQDSTKAAPVAKQDSAKTAPAAAPADTAKAAPAAKPDTTKAAPKADSTKIAPAAKQDTTKAAPKADSAKVAPAAKPDTTKATPAPQDTSVAAKDSTKADTSATADTAKVDSAAAPARVDTVYIVKDTTKSEKMRGKRYFKDHQDSVMAEKAKRDSLTTNHGISVMFGNNNDKRYGYIGSQDDYDDHWGAGFGIYYFYRHYFGSHFALEGRLGGVYRYARWSQDLDFPQYYNIARLGNGKYDLNHHVDIYYDNYAIDAPLSAKVGGHIGATEFLYAGITLNLMKDFYDKVTSRNELTLKNVSPEMKKDLEILEKEGKNPFPMVEDHYTSDWYQMVDWESGLWANFGLDSKFFSVEAQLLIMSAATTDYNHRFEYLGHDWNPTWRIFVDFSIR